MRSAIALLMLLLPLFPVAAHPLDGIRVDLCGPRDVSAAEPFAVLGRVTIADMPDSQNAGKIGLHAIVTVLLDDEVYRRSVVDHDGWYASGFLLPPGEHTIQAAFGLGLPGEARSPVLSVHVHDAPASEGLTLDVLCNLVYREPGYARVYPVVGGSGVAPAPETWTSVSGSVHVMKNDGCWRQGCDAVIDEQIHGFAGVVWGESGPDGMDLERGAWAAHAGPFTYAADLLATLPYCAPAWWATARAYAGGDSALTEDSWTGDDPSRACG